MFCFLVFFGCLQTFLVRKCSSSQRKVLCLRVTADKSASSVQECFICEEDSSEYKLLMLRSSALQFANMLGGVLLDGGAGASCRASV